MAQLRQDYEAFTERDTEIVVIGPDDNKAFASYWEKHTLPFVGLPDKKHTILKSYGQKVDLFKLGRMPAQMLINKKGTLRYVHYGHSMQDIPDNTEILELIDEG
jgi:peroxiredoxin Q/BCP